MISKTPKPPYYAVIFTSIRNKDNDNYNSTAERMVKLAREQKGFLGMESAREELGITVSYWDSHEAIRNWKMNDEHREAQQSGKDKWYKNYKIRICKVERDYEF